MKYNLIVEILLSLLTGVVSAFAYSLIQAYWQKRTWKRTKKYFLSKISGQRYLADYEILHTLQIDPSDDDSAKSDQEIRDEIAEADISDQQYERLYRQFRLIIENIENYRAQALALPTFTPEDFHGIDKELSLMGEYTFSYSFGRPLSENPEIRERLRKELIEIYNLIIERQQQRFRDATSGIFEN